MAHLAGKLIENIKRKQGDELGIDDCDVMCVKIAGLCHDLGIISYIAQLFQDDELLIFKVMAHSLIYGTSVFIRRNGRYIKLEIFIPTIICILFI